MSDLKRLSKKQIWKLKCDSIDAGKEFIKTNDEWKQIMIAKAKKDGTYLSARYKKFNNKQKKKTYWKKPETTTTKSNIFHKKLDEINYYTQLGIDLENARNEILNKK